MRREFRLPEADEESLNAKGLPWETVIEEKVQWLVIQDWPVPAGYNHGNVLLALVMPPSYPDSQIDMVYFYPHLALASGGPIGSLSARRFDGKDWQQWSRHRSKQNPWRPGEDDIAGHLLLVENWLRREVKGAAA